LQNLNFHDQLADASLSVVELLDDRIVLALLEACVNSGQSPIPPLFELLDRHRDLPRQVVHGLPAQQTQDDILPPTRRPAPHFGGAGLASSRAPCSFQRPRRNPTRIFPIQHF